MPKIVSNSPTFKRSVVLERDVYDRLMQHLGDTPGAFNDYIRRIMRRSVAHMDAKVAQALPKETQDLVMSLLGLDDRD